LGLTIHKEQGVGYENMALPFILEFGENLSIKKIIFILKDSESIHQKDNYLKKDTSVLFATLD